MMNLFNSLRTAAAQRAAYNRTVAELSTLDARIALEDLGLGPASAREIAWKTVYGR